MLPVVWYEGDFCQKQGKDTKASPWCPCLASDKSPLHIRLKILSRYQNNCITFHRQFFVIPWQYFQPDMKGDFVRSKARDTKAKALVSLPCFWQIPLHVRLLLLKMTNINMTVMIVMIVMIVMMMMRGNAETRGRAIDNDCSTRWIHLAALKAAHHRPPIMATDQRRLVNRNHRANKNLTNLENPLKKRSSSSSSSSSS